MASEGVLVTRAGNVVLSPPALAVVRLGSVELVLAGLVLLVPAALLLVTRAGNVVFDVDGRVNMVVAPFVPVERLASPPCVVPVDRCVVRSEEAGSRVLRSPACLEVRPEFRVVRSPPALEVRSGSVAVVLAGPVLVTFAVLVAPVCVTRVSNVVFDAGGRVNMVVVTRSPDLHTGSLFPSCFPVL